MTPDSHQVLTPADQTASARAKADALWLIMCETRQNLSLRGYPCFSEALPVWDRHDVARLILNWLPSRRPLDEDDMLYRRYTLEITVSLNGVTHFSGVPTLPLTLQSQPSAAASMDEVMAWGRLAVHEFENITRQAYDSRFPPSFVDRAFSVATDLFVRLGLRFKGAR